MLPSTLTLESYFVAIAYISIIIYIFGYKGNENVPCRQIYYHFFLAKATRHASITDKPLYLESKCLSLTSQHYYKFNFLST